MYVCMERVRERERGQFCARAYTMYIGMYFMLCDRYSVFYQGEVGQENSEIRPSLTTRKEAYSIININIFTTVFAPFGNSPMGKSGFFPRGKPAATKSLYPDKVRMPNLQCIY